VLHERRHQRVKRRFACEFLVEGQRYRGIVVELSRGGLFVQTDATTAPGSEIELHLAGAGVVPDMTLRAVVVRRRMVPAPLATAVRRGIGLEILEAPREYGLACGSELLEAPIRLARRGQGPGVEAASPSPPREPERAPPSEPPGETPRAQIAERVPAPPPRASAPDGPPRPDVLLVDDGGLADLEALLRELGADTTCIRLEDAGAPQPCVRPRRLFVTTARLACSLLLPDPDREDGLVALAVAEDESQTLSTLMRRLGFQYLVHRPSHPEALRLLLRQILYRGAEHRRAERLPFGCEVAWRSGWRTHRDPMVEISTTGCRLHARRGARLGARIRISIPPEATGDRRIVLRGRVARRDARARSGSGEGYALGVEFDPLTRRMERRLQALLERSARGPTTLPRLASTERPDRAAPESPTPSPAAPSADAGAAGDAGATAAGANAEAGTAGAAADGGALPDARAAGASPPDRRRLPRARLEREVVALDEAGTRALRTLVGRDLSPAGMRVDPHPELALRQRLRLALYEPSVAQPVVLDAEVARDDGGAGFALRFVDVAPEVAEQIARIVAALPAVQSLRPEPRRIVIGELLRERPAA
jgi:hypothetical protein